MNKEKTLDRILHGDLPLDFNWNRAGLSPDRLYFSEPTAQQAQEVVLVSECLRDGLHGIQEQPSLEQRVQYVEELSCLGINYATVGIFPGFGNKNDRTIKELIGEMRDQQPEMIPIVLTQATEDALKWTLDCKQINPKLTSLAFMGTAPSRLLVEGWEKDDIIERLNWLVSSLSKSGIEVIGATEHTTQTPPEFLKRIITAQVESGANYFCIADTIGTSRPSGASRITVFVREVLHDLGRDDIQIDWHGHRDLGNDLANAMSAIAAGANRVHVVAGGIGERAGNTSMEAVILNLSTIIEEAGGRVPWALPHLAQVFDKYHQITKIPIPEHGPLANRAFTTSLGIHTAAMYKSHENQQRYLDLAKPLRKMERTVYSAVDPEQIGRTHQIKISPWSGSSTVLLAAAKMGIDTTTLTAEKIEFVLQTAKGMGRELTDFEFKGLINDNH